MPHRKRRKKKTAHGGDKPATHMTKRLACVNVSPGISYEERERRERVATNLDRMRRMREAREKRARGEAACNGGSAPARRSPKQDKIVTMGEMMTPPPLPPSYIGYDDDDDDLNPDRLPRGDTPHNAPATDWPNGADTSRSARSSHASSTEASSQRKSQHALPVGDRLRKPPRKVPLARMVATAITLVCLVGAGFAAAAVHGAYAGGTPYLTGFLIGVGVGTVVVCCVVSCCIYCRTYRHGRIEVRRRPVRAQVGGRQAPTPLKRLRRLDEDKIGAALDAGEVTPMHIIGKDPAMSGRRSTRIAFGAQRALLAPVIAEQARVLHARRSSWMSVDDTLRSATGAADDAPVVAMRARIECNLERGVCACKHHCPDRM